MIVGIPRAICKVAPRQCPPGRKRVVWHVVCTGVRVAVGSGPHCRDLADRRELPVQTRFRFFPDEHIARDSIVNATLAEFVLRHVSDAAELAQRAKVLAALTQLPPERRNELAEAVDMVCRAIAARGGRGKVRFSLVKRGGQRRIEVSVCDEGQDQASAAPSASVAASDKEQSNWEAAVAQRVRALVDDFESSAWPSAGAIVRMAQILPPAFALPSDAEVANWARLLQSNTAVDALNDVFQRVRSLERDLGFVRCQQQLQAVLGSRTSQPEQLAMLALVISKTKNAIAILEPRGTIMGVNEAFAQMTGYAPQEAVGKPWCDLLCGPSTEPAAVAACRRALAEGHELTHDVLLYRQDGGTYWVESDLIPVRHGDGRLTQWIVIDTDITKRRETEEALRAAKDTAEKNSRLKSEFLANMSHEIRTPMNAIIGMTDLALGTPLTDEQREYLNTVRSSSESLLNLLNDILDLSKIEAGKMEIEEVDFDLREVVQDAVRTLAVKAQQKGLTLSCHLADDVPPLVHSDPLKLRQILLNLVGNAIKFTQQGEVVVSVEVQWRGDEEYSLHFAVRDTGIGIAEEKRDEIFQAFRQGDASTTRQFGGTGLGLAISSELVRMLQGRIWVDSTPGRGSTFHFTAQMRPGQASEEQAAAVAVAAELAPPVVEQADWKSAPRVRPLQVVVADDHAANRQLVTSVLRSRGHHCTETADGQETLDALEQHPCDVLLIDVQMPVLDGFQTTAAIRRQEESTRRHLPIIALTAHAMAGDREKCLAAGMDAYLAKPIRPKQLVELVESVVHLKPPGDAPQQTDENSHTEPQGFDLRFALESLDNDVELLASQMRFFLQDAPVLLSQLDHAIEHDEPYPLELAAHRLKGMLARYAFHEAAALALELEHKGKAQQLSGAGETLQKLRPLVSRLATAIEQYLERAR